MKQEEAEETLEAPKIEEIVKLSPEEAEKAAKEFLAKVANDFKSWNVLQAIEGSYSYFSKRFDSETARYMTIAFVMTISSGGPFASNQPIEVDPLKTSTGRKLRK